MSDNKILKVVLFLILIIVLIIIVLLDLFGRSLSTLSKEEIIKNKKSNAELLGEIKVNGVDTVYDKISNTYFLNVPPNSNNNYILKLDLDKGLKYKILGYKINIVKVNYKKPIKVIIYNNKYYYETKIQFSNLPLISINSNYEITDNDVESEFKYINQSNTDSIIKSNIKIRIRGASSLYLDKKSYKINIYNKKYTDTKKINIPKFYYGSSFILDSVYRDNSKIRNVLSIDIWNQVSDDFNNIDVHSEFVEVFINNEYNGLYVLTEPINRTKLNLNKTTKNDSSIIVKSSSWNTFDRNTEFSDIDTDSYLGYEIKYPNEELMFPSVWELFIKKIRDYYDEGINNTDKIIKNTFDVTNYVDLLIFNSFINNSDNKIIKNNYFYMKSFKDNKMFVQPWDMEFSFGLGFSKEKDILAQKKMNSYKSSFLELTNKYSPEINKMVIKRYWQLRKNILTEENLISIVENYENMLINGAASRDANRWSNYNIKNEIKDIKKWIHYRFIYFDEYVRGLENE